MKRVGAGVIGTGFWGENQVRVLRQSPKCNLVGICDSDRDRARQVGSKYSVPWYTDVREFLRVPEIEAVTVATPTHTHFRVGTRVLEAGKNLLVEKPMTGSQEQAQKLLATAKKGGLKLMVGFIERFNPGVRFVKKLLDESVAGEVIIATGRRVARWPIRIGDVGVIKDTAIHDIDIMRFLLNDKVSVVYAQIGSLKHSFEDYAEIMLRFTRGVTGFLDANWLTPRKVRSLIITGSEATIILDYITQEITVENSKTLTQPLVRYDEPLRLELEHFMKTVSEDLDPVPSGKDAIEAIRVCDTAIRSGRTKTVCKN